MPMMPGAPFAMMHQAMELVHSIYNRTPKYLDYLPGIFHEEGSKSMSPLWALLLIMEDNFGEISDKIDDIDRYFDVHRAPDGSTENEGDFLSWLGEWVKFIPEKDWSEQKKRYVVKQATDLHKYRGTMIGLRYMLSLFFEIDVEIKEWAWPKGMIIGTHDTIGIDTRLHDRVNINNCFVVFWSPGPIKNKPEFHAKVRNIRAMIDREKPAHTKCYFHIKGTSV